MISLALRLLRPLLRARPLAAAPRRRVGLLGALVFGALLLPATSVQAAWDDYEFGQKLIDRGYLDYAKRVFQSILDNSKASPAEKERAKFGMALLGKADLTAAQGNLSTPFATITQKVDAAASQIQDFIAKNPNDAKANDARFALGGLHLGFVQWCSDLVERDEECRKDKAKEAGSPKSPAEAAEGPLPARRARDERVGDAHRVGGLGRPRLRHLQGTDGDREDRQRQAARRIQLSDGPLLQGPDVREVQARGDLRLPGGQEAPRGLRVRQRAVRHGHLRARLPRQGLDRSSPTARTTRRSSFDGYCAALENFVGGGERRATRATSTAS